MQISLSVKSSAITPPMKDYALQKAEKLDKYLDNIQKIEVVLDTEKERKIAEVITFVPPGQKMVARGVEEDIHAAIDFAIDKMERQLSRFKSKLRDHRRKQKDSSRLVKSEAQVEGTDEPDEAEETYQEIVDKTDFGESPEKD